MSIPSLSGLERDLRPAAGILGWDIGGAHVKAALLDARGRLVTKVDPGQVAVYEDGVRQEVRNFSRDQDTPLTLGLLMDRSGSQSGLEGQNFDMAVAFLRGILRPQDQALIQEARQLAKPVNFGVPGGLGAASLLPYVLRAFGRHDSAESHADSPLSPRETQILQLIADGTSNSDIAHQLSIGLGTVKGHIRDIMEKLSASDRTHAAVIALRRGLI